MQYIIGDLSGVHVVGYRGMDRCPYLYTSQDLDQDLLDRLEVLVPCAAVEDEAEIIALYQEALAEGAQELDLLAVDHLAAGNGQDWRLIGYDVGEKNDEERAWSAINRHFHYGAWSFLEPWEQHLNACRLFKTRAIAAAFLAHYLTKSNDPVFEWSTPDEDALLYQVAAIYRYQPRTSIFIGEAHQRL